MENINRGDLVKTEEGYYAIVLRMAPDDQAIVAISNGLIWDESPETLEKLPLKVNGSFDAGAASANFMEILRGELIASD